MTENQVDTVVLDMNFRKGFESGQMAVLDE
jgi:hypothetical protein